MTLGEQELEEQLDACLEAVELDYLLARYTSAPHIHTYCFLSPQGHKQKVLMAEGRCFMPSAHLQHYCSHNLPVMADPGNVFGIPQAQIVHTASACTSA